MRHCAAAIALTLALATNAGARPLGTGEASGRPVPSGQSCLIEVLASEQLPGAPIFQALIRARLRITPQGQPPFERMVERFISWQEPPPRRGQRRMVPCNPTSLNDLPLY